MKAEFILVPPHFSFPIPAPFSIPAQAGISPPPRQRRKLIFCRGWKHWGKLCKMRALWFGETGFLWAWRGGGWARRRRDAPFLGLCLSAEFRCRRRRRFRWRRAFWRWGCLRRLCRGRFGDAGRKRRGRCGAANFFSRFFWRRWRREGCAMSAGWRRNGLLPELRRGRFLILHRWRRRRGGRADGGLAGKF